MVIRARQIVPVEPDLTELAHTDLTRAAKVLRTRVDLSPDESQAVVLASKEGAQPRDWHESAALVRELDPAMVAEVLAISAPHEAMKSLRRRIEGLGLADVAKLYAALKDE